MNTAAVGDPASTSNTLTVVMLGLPSSGKTTFLSSLWHLISRASPGSELALETIPGDLEYLNSLSDQWLRCEVAAHTRASLTHSSTLELRGAGETPVSLVLADYSGEFLREAWVTRHLAGQVDVHLRAARSIVLFIHPGYVTPRVSLEEANRNASVLEAGPTNQDLQADVFDLAKVPTQTILVDLLQFARSRTRAKRLPVAVVVSAWDLAEADAASPTDWVEHQLPLLSQFLATNTDSLPYAIFGVSAQGGSWEDDRASLLELPPDARPRGVDATGAALSDAAEPIRWAVRQV